MFLFLGREALARLPCTYEVLCSKGRDHAMEQYDKDSGSITKQEVKQDDPVTKENEELHAIYRMTLYLSRQMEQARIVEYAELLNKPWRMVWTNLLSGAAKGVGIAIGFTIFAATIVYFLQLLGALNLPIVGDYIADIVRIVQRQLELSTY